MVINVLSFSSTAWIVTMLSFISSTFTALDDEVALITPPLLFSTKISALSPTAKEMNLSIGSGVGKGSFGLFCVFGKASK